MRSAFHMTRSTSSTTTSWSRTFVTARTTSVATPLNSAGGGDIDSAGTTATSSTASTIAPTRPLLVLRTSVRVSGVIVVSASSMRRRRSITGITSPRCSVTPSTHFGTSGTLLGGE